MIVRFQMQQVRCLSLFFFAWQCLPPISHLSPPVVDFNGGQESRALSFAAIDGQHSADPATAHSVAIYLSTDPGARVSRCPSVQVSSKRTKPNLKAPLCVACLRVLRVCVCVPVSESVSAKKITQRAEPQ